VQGLVGCVERALPVFLEPLGVQIVGRDVFGHGANDGASARVSRVPEDHFGEEVAARYDDSEGWMFDSANIEAVADFLADLAGNGAALELGIGTGRIALPLAERGVPVHGIYLSVALVARLRAKPGGDRIPVTIGDFATTRIDESFSLAYLVFNTINNLTTQDEQVACFENVAAHLESGGCFVIEVGVPSREPLEVFALGDTHVGIDERDIATQRLVSHHFMLVDGQWVRRSIPFRSVSPAELDLMARLAGMTLRERSGGWKHEPFTSESAKHVSVWEKA
jgi:SAM-dependent methyltransferase